MENKEEEIKSPPPVPTLGERKLALRCLFMAIRLLPVGYDIDGEFFSPGSLIIHRSTTQADIARGLRDINHFSNIAQGKSKPEPGELEKYFYGEGKTR